MEKYIIQSVNFRPKENDDIKLVNGEIHEEYELVEKKTAMQVCLRLLGLRNKYHTQFKALILYSEVDGKREELTRAIGDD